MAICTISGARFFKKNFAKLRPVQRAERAKRVEAPAPGIHYATGEEIIGKVWCNFFLVERAGGDGEGSLLKKEAIGKAGYPKNIPHGLKPRSLVKLAEVRRWGFRDKDGQLAPLRGVAR